MKAKVFAGAVLVAILGALLLDNYLADQFGNEEVLA